MNFSLKGQRVDAFEVDHRKPIDPDEVLASVHNAKLCFIMFLVFDITVVLNSIAQLWSLASTSDTADFMRKSAFGEHVNMTLAHCSATVVGLCFLWDAFLGGVMVHMLNIDPPSVMSSETWEKIQTLANLNWYCNFGTLMIWLAARLVVVGMNPDWVNMIALSSVFLLRILKMRPMYLFKTCVDDVSVRYDKKNQEFPSTAFDKLHECFGVPEDHSLLWKIAGCSIATMVLIVILLFVYCVWSDSNAASGYGQAGDVDIPPLPVTAPAATQQPSGQQLPVAQPPPPPPPVQGSLRNLQAASRQLNPGSKDQVIIDDYYVYWCHDHSMDSFDSYGCGDGYVAKHYITNKKTDAFFKGAKTGALAGGMCAAAALGLDTTGYGLPAGLALGAACAIGFGGADGAHTFIKQIKDDDCIPQCDDDLPYTVKRDLWCIPYDHPEMLLCDHCEWCQMCDGDRKRGFDFSVDQC